VNIRPALPADAEAWLRLRRALWPEGSEADHREDIDRFFAGEATEPVAVLLATDQDDNVVGMAEMAIRPYAEGCASGRVAFLEGWFVASHARRRGVGRSLVLAAEQWGRAQGCTEMASDTPVHNTLGADAHKALGFEEVAIVRCFRKEL
jgi:aminoglycoside 6'-N-acetyltransferase I